MKKKPSQPPRKLKTNYTSDDSSLLRRRGFKRVQFPAGERKGAVSSTRQQQQHKATNIYALVEGPGSLINSSARARWLFV